MDYYDEEAQPDLAYRYVLAEWETVLIAIGPKNQRQYVWAVSC